MGDIADDAMEKVIDEWANGSLDEQEEDIEKIVGEFITEYAGLTVETQQEWLEQALNTLSIKIHEEAIKELEGRIGKNKAWGDAIELSYDECIRDTITYHQKEIKRLTE